ncbi:MAG: DUF1585 domain-containing protein, partial [Myxococcales bacterium]|nr:DUF1585 domain-containing protein [Myxococcales bacterium]
FESYDAIGRYRVDEGGVAIDPSGELPSGVGFSGVPELAALIADDPAFVHCATRKALTYALGRGLGADDEAHVDAIAEELAERGYGLRELFVLVATSEPFVSRDAEGS